MAGMHVWLALKRPLLLAFFLGCFLTHRGLTLRVIAPAMIYWIFLPLIEIVMLAVTARKSRSGTTFGGLIDSFFGGFTPWLVWLLGMCTIWAFLTPSAKAFDWTVSEVWMIGGVLA